jgi:hypothetical protein
VKESEEIMTKVIIKVKNCEPAVNNPHVSRKNQDEIEWKNQDKFDVKIDFDKLPAPIFVGDGDAPSFVVPAHGSVSVRLLADAPTGRHAYHITSDKCTHDEINPDAIIVDP